MASSTWTGKDQLQRCHAVPLSALNVSSRRIIGEHLNPVIYSQHVVNGIQQDWAGLAELIGFQYNEIQTMLEAKTEKALSSWTTKKGATIGKLLKHLETMERFDLLENTHFQQAVLRDVDSYQEHREEQQMDACSTSHMGYQPVQDGEVSSAALSSTAIYQSTSTDHHVDQFKNITCGEVRMGHPESFDAFICYTAKSRPDIQFVKQMAQMLEKRHGLKLCIPDRDLIPGTSTYTVISFLIERRCKKMINVLSKAYLKSPECDFALKFGVALSPGARSKKLIPVLIEEDCYAPAILRAVTLVDYTKCDLQEWFWERLACALKEPMAENSNLFEPSGPGIAESMDSSSSSSGGAQGGGGDESSEEMMYPFPQVSNFPPESRSDDSMACSNSVEMMELSSSASYSSQPQPAPSQTLSATSQPLSATSQPLAAASQPLAAVSHPLSVSPSIAASQPSASRNVMSQPLSQPMQCSTAPLPQQRSNKKGYLALPNLSRKNKTSAK